MNETSREFKEKAVQRLELYASKLCMKCTTLMVNDGDEMQIPTSRNEEYYKFKINFDENPAKYDKIGTVREPSERSQINTKREKDAAKIDHIICFKCIDKILKLEAEENMKKRKSTGDINESTHNNKVVYCKICEDDHVIDIKEWNGMFKKPCCQGCVIF